MAREVFVVESASIKSAGKYILIVQQSHGMFGGSTSSFSIDKLKYVNGPPRNLRPFSIQGLVGSRVIVEFSPDSSFIMLDKKVVKTTTQLDLEIEDRRDGADAKKRLDKEFPGEGLEAVAMTEDGRTKVNTQGYL